MERKQGILQIAEIRMVLRPYLQVALTAILVLGLLGGWAGPYWPHVLGIVILLIGSIIWIGRLVRTWGAKPIYIYITALINLGATAVIVIITGGESSPFWLLFLFGSITSAMSFRGIRGTYLNIVAVTVAILAMAVPELVTGRQEWLAVVTVVGMKAVALLLLGQMIRKATLLILEREEALRESESRLRLLVNQVPAILWTTDTDLRFTSSLGIGLTALNLQIDQVVGQTLFDYFQTEDDSFLPIAAHRQALAGDSKNYEMSWGNNSYQTHVEPLIDATGQIIGTIGIALDVTDRKQAEEAFRQVQKAESLGILAGGIAHDFNNLLTAMLAQTSLALAKLPPQSASRTHIEKATNATKRAANLTQQLLAYTGRGQFEMRPIHLNLLIKENLGLFETAPPKTVQLQAELAESLPVIEADTGQMQQVIMNLILNAVEAIGENPGFITVSTESIEVVDDGTAPKTYEGKTLPAGLYAVLTVSDDGLGMDADTLKRIFDPFFTTKFTGRGLGLAAVLGIVRGHNGGLQVESQPGGGTTFRLFFPATYQQER